MATSAGYPPDSLENLRFNTFLDGLFHAATYIFVVIGLVLLWRAAHRQHPWWSGKMMMGSVLIGFGLFNVVEGIVDHHVLKLHHVNETPPPGQWIYWDVGFMGWGQRCCSSAGDCSGQENASQARRRTLQRRLERINNEDAHDLSTVV